MDPRLTRLYQDELTQLRELGQEFAREHPKIARRLGLEGQPEVADPYVERLLEGFAFIAARLRLKLEAEQPELVAQLLQGLYPQFLAPVPSMAVLRLDIDPSDPNLAQGAPLPRGSAVLAQAPRGTDTACEYRTAHALTLWPLTITQVQYQQPLPDPALLRLPAAAGARAGLRIRLRAGEGLTLQQLPLDRLAFYIAAPDDVAMRLHELVLGQTLGTLVSPVAAPGTAAAEAPLAARWRGADSVQPLGLDDDQALLPETLRSFSGHRLIQELATLPQRLLFFELTGLRERLASVAGAEVDVTLLFARGDAELAPRVDADSLALHCTPAINLYPKRLDRVSLGPDRWEYHVVADRTRPLDFEVHSLLAVQGHGSAGQGLLDFQPLYHWQHDSLGRAEGGYTLRREPRRPSERQRLQGARVPDYLGEEVFLSLLDPGHGPYREGLQQLTVQALVTNRDLPALLPQGEAGGSSTWRLESPGPVRSVRCLRGPTRPYRRPVDGEPGWQLLAQLTRQHVALEEDDDALPAGRASAAARATEALGGTGGPGPQGLPGPPPSSSAGSPATAATGAPGSATTAAERNAAALRLLLRLHGAPGDRGWAHLVEGLRQLQVRRQVRRLPFPGPVCVGSGLGLTLQVDEQAFHGHSAFLLARVIEPWLARHAGINSHTQLTLDSLQRGPLMRWPARAGTRAIA